MAEHTCTRERGTDDPDSMGYLDWERVVCSCGWKSNKVHNYHNSKYSALAESERLHLRLMKIKDHT